MEVPTDKFIDIVEFYDSLTRAITDAGGGHPNIKHLMNMTVKELGERLAPNGIRFVCLLAPPKQEPEPVQVPTEFCEGLALALVAPALVAALDEQLRGKR